MKRKISLLIVILLIVIGSVPVFSGSGVGVVLNNIPIQFDSDSGFPFIDSNSRTLVPLRITMESAGYTVSWDAKNRVASVHDNDGTSVHVKIGDNYINKEIISNGVKETSRIKNDTFAQIVNGRTYLPIRIVLEAFGALVSWDGVGRNVLVNTSSSTANKTFTAEQIFEKYSSSVVYIEIYDANGDYLGSGSGFIISKEGIVVTNYHVIENASYATAFTPNGKSYNVDGVLDYSKEYDLAKIKIAGNNLPFIDLNANAFATGGSPAFAMGSPLGLQNTISEGIISNPNRIISGISYYQTTAPISHGSSGGPLFNKFGEVIGVTTAIFTEGQNLNIAVPISNINRLSGTSLKNLPSYGKVSKPTQQPQNNIDYSSYYYPGFYPAPNFGTFFNVPLYDYFYTDDGVTFDYSTRDLQRILGTYDFISKYSEVLKASGFYYAGGFVNDSGNTVMYYNNYSYSLTLYTYLTDYPYRDFCYTIMILRK